VSEPRLNDPISEEPSYWRCRGCNEYFHPEKYNWHVDEECEKNENMQEKVNANSENGVGQ
jgi:hypothetical protein